jgi:hypothetical protein
VGGRRLLLLLEVAYRRSEAGGMLGLWYGELADRSAVGVMFMQLTCTDLALSEDGQESYTDDRRLQHLERRGPGLHVR